MRANEMITEAVMVDNIQNVRRPKLTLMHLRKLRQRYEKEQEEREAKLIDVQNMYGDNEEVEGESDFGSDLDNDFDI